MVTVVGNNEASTSAIATFDAASTCATQTIILFLVALPYVALTVGLGGECVPADAANIGPLSAVDAQVSHQSTPIH